MRQRWLYHIHWSWKLICPVDVYSEVSNNQTHINDRYFEHFQWHCPQVNSTRPHWWLVNIGSGIGLLLKTENVASTHYGHLSVTAIHIVLLDLTRRAATNNEIQRGYQFQYVCKTSNNEYFIWLMVLSRLLKIVWPLMFMSVQQMISRYW